MKIFYSETHRLHDPAFEVFDGGQRVPYLESPERMERILKAIRKMDGAEILAPRDFGLDPLRAVHSDAYLAFLASAWTEWLAATPETAAASDKTALLPATFAAKRDQMPETILGKAGFFLLDLSVPVVEGTYAAALSSANCALSAAEFISESINHPPSSNSSFRLPLSAFGLCRPPGHHAGREIAGGYCFLNNAAIAAQWLTRFGRVAILDVDYHACNGTQDIFYNRRDVLTISIHADPSFEYPYYAGYAQEAGEGEGLGFHHNFPLPAGTNNAAYLVALDQAIALIKDYGPQSLVISLGMDTYGGDPLGAFKLTREGIGEIGHHIAALNLPTAIIIEGGYNTDELGKNVVEILRGFQR
ncbi:MAG: histone deacetylase family protein [Anaerolineaceae bacterium]|nr:MAG: histone deacetylase family protein [Anaerolineaceae bacterium]